MRWRNEAKSGEIDDFEAERTPIQSDGWTYFCMVSWRHHPGVSIHSWEVKPFEIGRWCDVGCLVSVSWLILDVRVGRRLWSLLEWEMHRQPSPKIAKWWEHATSRFLSQHPKNVPDTQAIRTGIDLSNELEVVNCYSRNKAGSLVLDGGIDSSCPSLQFMTASHYGPLDDPMINPTFLF